MRTQKIITINTNTVRRGVEEWEALARRRDLVLNERLALLQGNMPEWDLLSVVPAGNDFPTGFYTTTWEYDSERYENDALDSTDEVEAFSKGYLKSDPDVKPTPSVEMGDSIEVNGVYFRLTHFSQSAGLATVEFIDERQLEQDEQDEPWEFYRGPGLGYGVRRRHPFLAQPTGPRYDGAKRRI